MDNKIYSTLLVDKSGKQNKNTATAIKSWPTSCSTFASYYRCS